MLNLARDAEALAAESGEKIDVVVLGASPGDDIGGKALAWEIGRSHLDKDYPFGYDPNGRRPFVAYTPNWILFAHDYDGKITVWKLPRNPLSGVVPQFVGTRFVEDDTGFDDLV